MLMTKDILVKVLGNLEWIITTGTHTEQLRYSLAVYATYVWAEEEKYLVLLSCCKFET
jgi:hypothetical protein